MADTAVTITAGSGTNIDTRTEATNGNHRQVIVVGDPSTNAGVAPVDATAGLKVDLGADNDVTVASLPLPTGAATSAKQDTVIGHLDGVEGILTTIDADTGSLAGAVAGTEMQVDVVAALPAGANAIGKLAANSGVDIGDVDVTSISAGTNTIGGVTPRPETANGLIIFRSLDLDESEEEVKATAGQVYGMWVTNTATTTRYLKFYNATAANVTVGTTTPVITWPIPGNASDDISAVFGGAYGIVFDTAITVAATTGLADNDTGAPSANDVVVNIFYK